MRDRPGFAKLRTTGYASAVVLASVVVAGIAGAAIRGYGNPVDPVVVLSLGLVLVGCLEVIRQRVASRGRAPAFDAPAPDAAGASSFASYYRLRVQLRGGQDDPDQLSRTIVPMLAELVDDLLSRSHGIRLSDRPDDARRLLGDELFDFVTSGGEAIRVPDVDLLDHFLARIEAL